MQRKAGAFVLCHDLPQDSYFYVSFYLALDIFSNKKVYHVEREIKIYIYKVSINCVRRVKIVVGMIYSSMKNA